MHNIKDEDGNVIVEGHKINERWQDYFKDLLNAGVKDVDEEEVEQGQEDLITMEEMEKALKKMKRDKSPGCDEIQIELVRDWGDRLKESILQILNRA